MVRAIGEYAGDAKGKQSLGVRAPIDGIGRYRDSGDPQRTQAVCRKQLMRGVQGMGTHTAHRIEPVVGIRLDQQGARLPLQECMGGNGVEVIRGRARFTAKNTLVVPVSNLPSSFTLFELVNNQYALVFKAGMEGKVNVNGSELTLQQAREKGLAKSRGDVLVLPLTDASKGRVALGEVSVLFQFVTPPPEPKREELPPTVKGNFFSQIDHGVFGLHEYAVYT